MSKREILNAVDKINEKVDKIHDEVSILPTLKLYEEILTVLNSIKRELVMLDNRIDKIEQRMRSKDLLEMNRNLRMYALKSGNDDSEPIKFIPASSSNNKF